MGALIVAWFKEFRPSIAEIWTIFSIRLRLASISPIAEYASNRIFPHCFLRDSEERTLRKISTLFDMTAAIVLITPSP